MLTRRPPGPPAAVTPRRHRVREFAFLPHLCFLVVALSATALLPAGPGLLALAATSCVMAISLALGRGGAYLTPSGVYFLASGVFIGGAAYYLSFVTTEVDPASLRDATALALLTTIGTSAVVTALSIGWRLEWPERTVAAPGALRPRPPRQFWLKGLAMVAVALFPLTQALVGTTAGSIGVGGIVVLVLWASSRQLHLRWYGDILIVSLAVVLPYLWVELTFTGGGRLMIAGISIASFVGWNLTRPRRIQKVLLISCIPLFLAFAGLSRLTSDDRSDATASTVVSSGSGLASVYAPLETWTRIIEPLDPQQRDQLGPRDGATFINTLLLPIPRGLWEDKPDGFGAELTAVFEPNLVKTNHSMAALSHGEWYANFGYGGLVLMMPVLGWFLAVLDRRHARLARDGLGTPRAWWQAAVLMCLVSSLADLFWVGTFTFAARGVLSAGAVALVGRLSLSRSGRAGSGATAPHRLPASPSAAPPPS